MAQTALQVGMMSTIGQNVSYALPAKAVKVNSSLAVQTSFDETTWAGLTGAETTGADTGARFIRCAVGNANVICQEVGNSSNQGWTSDNVKIDNYISVGTNPAQSGAIRLPNNTEIKGRNLGNNGDIIIASLSNDDTVRIGYGNTNGVLFGATHLQLMEKTAPPTTLADRAFIWLQDNGSGKSQLMIRFGTSAPVQIAIEP